MLRQWRERFRMGGGGGGGGSGSGGGGAGRGISWRVVAGVLFAGWVLSGVYTVNETQQAVITTFGKYTATTGPGIHWHAPAPIQARQVVGVTEQRTEEIGCTMSGEVCASDVPDESLMITGDRNIVQVHFRITYNVKDVEDFVFVVRTPVSNSGEEGGAVRQVAESAMREIVGRRQLEPIITTDREEVAQDAKDLAQRILDDYRAGVNLVAVELLSTTVPPEVTEAFNDVVKAGQDAESARNNANREASQIVNDAQGYQGRVVREATGEAQRFTSVYDEYRQAPQVTRDRLYIETMERVYRTGNLMILDQRGGAVPYLPLDNYLRRPQPAPQNQQQGGR